MAIGPMTPSTSAFRLNSWSNSRAGEATQTAVSTVPSDADRITNKLRKAVGVPPIPPVTVELPEPESTRPSTRATATASGEAGDAGMPTRPPANTYHRPTPSGLPAAADTVSRFRHFGNPPEPGPLAQGRPKPLRRHRSARVHCRRDGPATRCGAMGRCPSSAQRRPISHRPWWTTHSRQDPSDTPKVDLSEKDLALRRSSTRKLVAKESTVGVIVR